MTKQTWVVEVLLPEAGPAIGYFVLASNRIEAEMGAKAMINVMGCKIINAYPYESCAK